MSYNQFLNSGSKNATGVEVLPEDLHLILYTSGTTGQPKGAARTMYSAYNMAISSIIEMGLRKDDTFLVVAPMYAAATSGYVYITLMAGGTVFVAPSFEPENTLRLIGYSSC